MASFMGDGRRRIFIHPYSEAETDEQILATKVRSAVALPNKIGDISGMFRWLEQRFQVEDYLSVKGWICYTEETGPLPPEFDLHVRTRADEALGTSEWGDSLALEIAPSSITNDKFMLMQGIDPATGERLPEMPAFSNYRPGYAKPPIPLTLAHQVFGTFSDIFHGVGQTPDGNDYTVYLQMAGAFSNFYKVDEDYKDVVAQLWENFTGTGFIDELPTGGDTLCHLGARLFLERALIASLEAKVGPFRSNSDPGAQAPQYVRLYWQRKGDKSRFRNTCYPAICIEQLGSLVRVSAVATLDRFCCVPLTPFVNFLLVQGDDVRAAEQGARLILAVKVALKELTDFYTGFKGGPSRNLFFKKSIPYPLHYCPAPPARLGDKLVYLARLPGQLSVPVVVKFVQRPYGEDVHRAWAERGYAPQLNSVSRLAGGWWQVNMEFLSDSEGWKVLQARPDADELRPKVLEALAAAQQIPVTCSTTGEVGGGVHGDMRDVNVMVRVTDGKLEVRFIDFDWARPENSASACYPPFMNLQVNWQGGEDNKAMEQKHDTDLLSLSQADQSVSTETSPPSSSWGTFERSRNEEAGFQ